MINERVDKKVQGYRGVAHATKLFDDYLGNEDCSLFAIIPSLQNAHAFSICRIPMMYG